MQYMELFRFKVSFLNCFFFRWVEKSVFFVFSVWVDGKNSKENLSGSL